MATRLTDATELLLQLVEVTATVIIVLIGAKRRARIRMVHAL